MSDSTTHFVWSLLAVGYFAVGVSIWWERRNRDR